MTEGGSSSQFDINFKFMENTLQASNNETATEEDAAEDESETSTGSQNQSTVLLKYVISEIIESIKEAPSVVEEVKIEAQLRKIDEVGNIFIDFSPQIAAIPTNWTQMWDLSEREKMSP